MTIRHQSKIENLWFDLIFDGNKLKITCFYSNISNENGFTCDHYSPIVTHLLRDLRISTESEESIDVFDTFDSEEAREVFEPIVFRKSEITENNVKKAINEWEKNIDLFLKLTIDSNRNIISILTDLKREYKSS